MQPTPSPVPRKFRSRDGLEDPVPMCGIFLAVNSATTPLKLEPKRYSAAEIAHVVGARVALQTALSALDKQKVENAQNIRQRQVELGRLSVKNHGGRIAQLQREIAEMLVVSPLEADGADLDGTLVDIMARGPDYAELWEAKMGKWFVLGLSSVLSLRQPFAVQPWTDERYVFQFNGELYNEGCFEANDGQFAFEAVEACKGDVDRLGTALSSLNGEFAFVLTDKSTKTVFFGKDHIGKRSLLYSTANGLAVGSVLSHLPEDELVECEPGVLYVYDVENEKLSKTPYPKQLRLDAVSGESFDAGYDDTAFFVDQLHSHLKNACLVRQKTVHPLHTTQTQVAVLFSGGLDCTILASLIAENYESLGEPVKIDLLTVGFENPRTGLSALESPDRKLSEQLWFELSKKFKNSPISFRLVQVDVSYAEWLSHKNRVLDLIRPTATEMDLSIGIAFYFASRPGVFTALTMEGVPEWEEFQKNRDSFVSSEKYTSNAKVLFSGLGADELYGGYSRHEAVFDSLRENAAPETIHRLYDELSKSLHHDITAIYNRNLGRDDRAISSWGKELRYPYLDSAVVEFLASLAPHYKVQFRWTTVKTKKGEKRAKLYSRKYLLRQLCHALGLPMAAEEVKRAIQFGAKLAKLEVGQSKTKGTERAAQ